LEIAGFPNFLANGVVVHISRNSASSRAIPVKKMIAKVLEDPFVPEQWPVNRPGMQATEYLEDAAAAQERARWLAERDHAVACALRRVERGIHKQIANRLIEPWLWHTVIVTATEWANFFALRCDKDAQPEIRKIALMMRELYDGGQPAELVPGQWHAPLLQEDELYALRAAEREGLMQAIWWARISCARCARVSYLTHEGVRDPNEDLALATRLQDSGHNSPFEHAAEALPQWGPPFIGNFRAPWSQYRKRLPNEAVFVPKGE
jgi:hypothetical protein